MLVTHEICTYPELAVQDIYKLIFQTVNGSEHAIQNYAQVKKNLEIEMQLASTIPESTWIQDITFQTPLVRIHFRSDFSEIMTMEKIVEAFMATRKYFKNIEKWRMKAVWAYCKKYLKTETGKFPSHTFDKFDEWLLKNDYPSVHHSPEFKSKYQPHYRILHKDLLP